MTSNDLELIANVVVELYDNNFVKNFVPSLGKGGRGTNTNSGVKIKGFKGRGSGVNINKTDKVKNAVELDDIFHMKISQGLINLPNKDPIDQMLKATILSNIPAETKITENGIKRNELKKGIDILRSFLNNLIARNTNSQNDEELEKYQHYLHVLEEKYATCLEEGNFEKVKDFKALAVKAMKILNKNDTESIQLFTLINKKFGVDLKKVAKTKRDIWMSKWAQYEEEVASKVVIYNLTDKEKQEYEDYKRQKNRVWRPPTEYRSNGYCDNRHTNFIAAETTKPKLYVPKQR